MIRRTSPVILLAILTLSTLAMAMGGDIERGTGAGGHPDDWPKGVMPLLDLQAHEGGVWVNANDFYWFAGDTAALSKFLAEAGKIEGATLRFRINAGKGLGHALVDGGPGVPMDWQLGIQHRGWSDEWPDGSPTPYLIVVDIWPGERIDTKKLTIPATIKAFPSTQPTTKPAG